MKLPCLGCNEFWRGEECVWKLGFWEQMGPGAASGWPKWGGVAEDIFLSYFQDVQMKTCRNRFASFDLGKLGVPLVFISQGFLRNTLGRGFHEG